MPTPRVKLTEAVKQKLEVTKQHIQENLSKHYSIEELAVKFGLTFIQLKFGFKQAYKVNVFEFLQEERMVLATRLLETTEKSLVEIGNLCGYKEVNNFIPAFKRRFKMTPGQYVGVKRAVESNFSDSPIQLTEADKKQLTWVRDLILKDITTHHTIQWLSEQTGLNTFKLKVGFKMMFGQTIYALLETERLKLAVKLLQTTDEPINVISEKCGYQFPTNFTAIFKKRFNVLPNVYRNTFRMTNGSTLQNKKEIALTEQDITKVKKAANLIQNSLANHISIKELSANTKLDPRKLMLGFKQQYGLTVYNFLRTCRMQKAKELIDQNTPMHIVLSEVGYKRESDFLIAFQKVIKQSPDAWKGAFTLLAGHIPK